jgi:hypothetical protein
MERQTSEHINLHARRASPGTLLSINYGPIKIKDVALLDAKIRLATRALSNGQVAGALGMHAKQVKDWLQGVQWEENPKSQGAPGNGDNW